MAATEPTHKLYDFQRQAVQELTQPQKHIVVAQAGSGKSAVALSWALTTGKRKWLVTTTASARDSAQWHRELEMWCGESSISLEVISWQGLVKWTVAHWDEINEYAFIWDEIQKSKSGISSARGRAFLQIAKRTDCWAGFTATPGDRWIDFQAYFIAGHYIKNKTEFLRQFCEVQTYRGFPEIVGYRDEDTLKRWWQALTVCPDTSKLQAELPPERHFTYTFKASPEYKRFVQTRTTAEGVFCDTSGSFCAECRRLCLTKQKEQWIVDYLDSLGKPTVLFYALTETGDRLCELAHKTLPKAKIWRVYGGKHDIPTAETIGPRDVVICQWEAGSEALNLQFLDEWVCVQPAYSYSTSVQGRGRIRRIGQTRPQNYHYLKCTDTIETDVYRALKEKSDFSADVWFLNKKGEL